MSFTLAFKQVWMLSPNTPQDKSRFTGIVFPFPGTSEKKPEERGHLNHGALACRAVFLPSFPPPSRGLSCCCMPAQSQVSAPACTASLYATYTPRSLRFHLGTPAFSQLHTLEALRHSGNCFWKLGHRW